MAFKIGSIRSKPGAAVGRGLAAIPRGWAKTPLARGIGLALLLGIAAYGWLVFEAGDTLQALEAATPPAQAVLDTPTPKTEFVQTAEKPSEQPVLAPALKAEGAIPDLIEQTPAGVLPRIGTDGTAPWRAYARADGSPGNKPKIAILVAGLGVSATVDDKAIHGLPAAVSLGFMAFSDRIAALIAQSRRKGHEVVLSTPMEPEDYPSDDPGPQTLLIKASATDNVARLDWHLARGSGYIGVAPTMGSRFTASPEPLQPVLIELAKRGLLYVDTGAAVFGAAPALARTIGVPIAVADRTVDRVPTRAAIDRELTDLETVAKRRGSAFGVATAYPSTLERLVAWAATLDAKGIALVPVSAIAQAPTVPPPRGGS